jgi:hypothetical protein
MLTTMFLGRYYQSLLLALVLGASSMGLANSPSGKKLYAQHCAECHGEKGEGVEDEYSKPLVGDWPITKLIHYVDKTMPDYDPDLVKGKEANAISRFLYESFYKKPELFKKDSKVQLARLTKRQYRQSVTDLFGQFEGHPTLNNPVRGLKGKYYNAEGMNKRKKMHAEQVDSIIHFNYRDKAALEGMNPKKFSVYWEGSILPRESGWYEFFVKSPNGFELSVNQSEGGPLIDEKVTAGTLREERAKLFLLGGRPYPIRLNYFKFDDPNASIELSWKTPIGEKEIIPAEYFYTQVVPPSFVSQQKLPPDDASHGYERGIQIDSTWDEATTFAALEASIFAGKRMDRLARTNEKDEGRKQKIKTFTTQFLQYAFREKLLDEEIERYVDSKFSDNVPLHISVEKIVLTALKSPRFLYPEWQALAKKEKDSSVVATRLALYFWDSIPDRKLHDMVDRNQFSKKPHIEGQVRRMLDDPRSQAKLNDFFLHWLDMKNKELPSLSKKRFPDFSPALSLDLRRSLLRWIENSIWEQMITWPQFLEMKKIEVNERIASFYGLSYPDDANTTGFVEMNASYLNRQGLHTHPYILASHSYPEESSPIHRGVFTARKILGRTLRPPTEAVSFRNADFDPNWTMRQKVTELTKAANCMSCHDQINSTGFVLENFDATGRNRSEIAGVRLDLKVNYLDSEGIERTLNGSQDLLSHALESTKPAKSFVDELFKHLAKQPVQSYHAIDTSKLSEMLQNEQLSLRDLYSQLGFLGASDGFSFVK